MTREYPDITKVDPSHQGWMSILPVWAWQIDDEAPIIKPRFFLPNFMLTFIASFQNLVCLVMNMEPCFVFELRTLSKWGNRWWNFEKKFMRKPINEI